MQNVPDKAQTAPGAVGSAPGALLLGRDMKVAGHFDLRAAGRRGNQALPPACGFLWTGSQLDSTWQGWTAPPNFAHVKARARAILGAGQWAAFRGAGQCTLKAPGPTLGSGLSLGATFSTDPSTSPTHICCPVWGRGDVETQ